MTNIGRCSITLLRSLSPIRPSILCLLCDPLLTSLGPWGTATSTPKIENDVSVVSFAALSGLGSITVVPPSQSGVAMHKSSCIGAKTGQQYSVRASVVVDPQRRARILNRDAFLVTRRQDHNIYRLDDKWYPVAHSVADLENLCVICDGHRCYVEWEEIDAETRNRPHVGTQNGTPFTRYQSSGFLASHETQHS